jgi:hypothetical protein
MAPATGTTSSAPSTLNGSQVHPGSHFKIDLAQREEKALAALEGKYQPETFIGKEKASSVTHLRRVVTKPLNSSNVNQAKLHQGGLNRGYSP